MQPLPLVGRQRELAEVLALLRNGTHLLTLTGPGGSGKTRLALQAAAELVGDFSDGVWFVLLAPLVDAQLVPTTIARTLGIADEALQAELERRTMLLLLDNLEQVEGAAPVVAGIAEHDGVRVLATSRERLAVRAKQECEVPPLPVPEGVMLFTARARQLVPTFDPDEEVAEIVAALDGLPLAVELAAVRTKVLTTKQILQRLGKRLELLTSGDRDAPRRQRTLRATIQWSHDLLTDEERALFARLAVFAGSFDLLAAEQVAAAELDTLASLLDESLMRQTGDGRYFMLETIREFALEQLEQRGERGEVDRRHCDHFLDRQKEMRDPVRAGQAEALRAVELDYDNHRAALEWAIESADAERVLAGAWFLCFFWIARGRLHEGRRGSGGRSRSI